MENGLKFCSDENLDLDNCSDLQSFVLNKEGLDGPSSTEAHCLLSCRFLVDLTLLGCVCFALRKEARKDVGRGNQYPDPTCAQHLGYTLKMTLLFESILNFSLFEMRQEGFWCCEPVSRLWKSCVCHISSWAFQPENNACCCVCKCCFLAINSENCLSRIPENGARTGWCFVWWTSDPHACCE